MQDTSSWPKLWDGRKDWTKSNIKCRMITWMMSLNWPSTCFWLNICDGVRNWKCLDKRRIDSWEGTETYQCHGGHPIEAQVWAHQRRANQGAIVSHVPEREERIWSSTTSLPTTILLTSMIDAFTRRDVSTVDTKGAFLHPKMPKGEEDMHVN